MIRRRDATLVIFHCDACTKTERVYTLDEHFDYPDGWACEPSVVLCPEHAHLTATVRLIESMLNGQTAKAVTAALAGPVGGVAGL